MAKNLVGILFVACCCLGVLCYRYHSTLRSLQAENAALRNQLEQTEVSLADQTDSRQELESRVAKSERLLAEATQREEALVKQVEEADKAASDAAKVVELTPEVVAKSDQDPDKAKGPAGFMGKLKEMMDKPGMRDAMRSQQKLALNMMYGTLFTKLKLDPERLELLKDLLVDQQMAGLDAVGSKNSQAITDARKTTEAALKELLNDEEYDTFQDYQKTIGERMVIQQLDQVLTQKSMAMTDVQQEELITLMVEERQAFAFPSAMDQQDQFMKDGMPDETQLESFLKKQEELNARILERAGEVLTPAQVEELGTFQESQLQMQRLGLQMMKGMMGGDEKK